MKLSIITFISIFGVAVASARELVTHLELFPDTEFHAWSFENNYLSYLSTDYIKKGSSEYEVRVIVVDGIFTSSSRMYNCSFVVHSDEYSYLHSAVIKRLDRDKVLLVPFKDIQKVKAIIVDLPTCGVVESKYTIYADRLFAIDGSYDIITINSSLCGDKYCQTTVNSQLNVVKGPVPWIKRFGDYFHLIDLKSDSSTDKKDLVYQMQYNKETDDMDTKFSLLTKEGLKLLVERYNLHLSVSYTNDAIGLIYSNDKDNNGTSLDVYQFDIDGNQKLHLTLNFSEPTRYAQMKNLPDGRFLLAVGKDAESAFMINVTKYDSNGRAVTKNMVMEGFQERVHPDFIFYQQFFFRDTGNNLNCLIQMREGISEIYGDSSTEIFEKCFREEDLESL